MLSSASLNLNMLKSAREAKSMFKINIKGTATFYPMQTHYGGPSGA